MMNALAANLQKPVNSTVFFETPLPYQPLKIIIKRSGK